MVDFLAYEGKRVIVSGCFSGMGEATARTLLSLGAEVHGLDFRQSTLKLASFTQVDLRDPASIDTAVGRIGGKVDALFNCAGLPQTSCADDVMKVNFIGTRHLTEGVLPMMTEGGAIASISSNGGLGWSQRIPVLMDFLQAEGFEAAVKWCEAHPDVLEHVYGFSKEAVILWTFTSSFDLIKRGVRINCTTPGPTQTPMMASFETVTTSALLDLSMQPINRRSSPEEQASALLFLNSPAASYVNGASLPVDGGFMAAMATNRIDLAALMAAATG